MRSTTTAVGPRLRFQQYVGGVPVRNGQVTVALGENGAVQHVASSGSPSTQLDTKARVSRAQALLTARRRVPSGFDTVVAPTTTLVGEPTASGGLQLAWHVVLATRAPRADWNVLVSARSGEVLKADDQITRVDGSALTYSPNPVQSTGNTGLRDVADSDQAALTNARQSFALTDLSAGTNLIRGTFADRRLGRRSAAAIAALHAGPGVERHPRPTTSPAARTPFEEAAAYLAVTRTLRTFAALGFPGIFPGPVPIDVHCIADDNSFFSTADDALHMGDGGVDDAEDSDVTVHELGHATQAAQVPGFGPGGPTPSSAPWARASATSSPPTSTSRTATPTYQATRRFCVMEWDATSYNPVVGGHRRQRLPALGRRHRRGQRLRHRHLRRHAERGARRRPLLVGDADLRVRGHRALARHGAVARNRMLELVLAHHENLVPTTADTAFADSLAVPARGGRRALSRATEIARINTCGEQRLGKVAPPDTTAPVVNGALGPSRPTAPTAGTAARPTVTWNISEPESAHVVTGCQQGADPADTPGRTINCTVTSAGGTTSAVALLQEGSDPADAGGHAQQRGADGGRRADRDAQRERRHLGRRGAVVRGGGHELGGRQDRGLLRHRRGGQRRGARR